MKEFSTAVTERIDPEDEEVGTPFTVDGVELHCFKPDSAQYAVLLASVGRHTKSETKIAGIINFFMEVLDDDSNAYLAERLLDRKDPFGLEQVEEIIAWMVEEWTGRPTSSPSVSTESQQNGGQKSTPPISPSTSSDSPFIGS